ncbi:MAG: RidA family protein [Bryobacteraceae bacterium]
MKVLASLAATALLLSAADRRAVVPTVGPKPVGPYTPGIMAGDYLYVSGQGARSPEGKFADTAEGRVRQCMENVKSIVTAAGLTMEHVVYTQVYLHKDTSYETFNKVWGEFFPKNPPARATLGVHRMPTETTVEMSAVAVRDVSMKKAIVPASYPKDVNLAPGMMVGNRLYLSGVTGRDPKTGKIPDTPEEQVQLALDRMKEILTTAGLDFRHVVFVNPYLTAKMPMGVMNKIYAKHFEFGNTPARATIQVSFLPHDTNIEFTGVAVRDLGLRRAIRPKNMEPSPTASPCVFADDTYYCSAKSGFIPGLNGGIYAENVEDQLRQSMRNLLDGLEEAGLKFSDVVASNVYVDNLDEFAKMNAVYAKYFKDLPPTRTTVSPIAPIERKRTGTGHFPKIEEVSVVAVR